MSSLTLRFLYSFDSQLEESRFKEIVRVLHAVPTEYRIDEVLTDENFVVVGLIDRDRSIGLVGVLKTAPVRQVRRRAP